MQLKTISIFGALTLFPALLGAQTNPGACTMASISGAYGYTIGGLSFAPNGSIGVYTETGTFTADGNGNLKGNGTYSIATLASHSLTGTYTVNSDCTGTLTYTDNSNLPTNVTLVVGFNGDDLRYLESDTGSDVSGRARRLKTGCSNASFAGSYHFRNGGYAFDSAGNPYYFDDGGKLVADGNGGLTATDTVTVSGTITPRTQTGTYTINTDCTGSASLTDSGGHGSHFNLTLVGPQHEVQLLDTDAGTVLSGTADAQAEVTPGGGAMAHVAAGGGWQTTFTLVNNGPVAAQAQLNFFDDNGNPLSLSLTVLQTQANTTGSTITQILAPGTELVIQAQSTAATLTGSAQLVTSGTISGFAVFRYNPSGQEAVVPLETRNANAYVLSYDNTNGLATGLAVANLTGSAATVQVILRDDAGTNLGTQAISLPAQGHTSFILTQNYSAVANKRGTVEFDTPPGQPISVLGLRVNGAAVTTIPVLAR